MTDQTHTKLIRLRDLILEERRYAQDLEMDRLLAAMKEKEELINYLSVVQELDPEDKELAAEIRRENRRNAFLYKSALGWIRETMEFFGKRTVTSTYAADAGTVPAQVNGRLLSGKV
ncbi:MAG: flagellar protein FlgN [Desulfobulbaceae bacterium]|nr:MAG: flagellar protein FlgN [Desulfobulbaceae bacterium]